MSKEAMKLALEALVMIAKTEYHIETPPIESLEEKMRRIARKAIPALREALAKPDFWEGYVPEPVKPAQQEPSEHGRWVRYEDAQRTWVGLPVSAFAGMTLQQASAMKYAELICKEKNT